MKVLKFFLIVAAACMLLPAPALTIAVLFFPVDKNQIEKTLEPSTRIYDRHGTLLREIVNGNGERCNPVRLKDVSPHLVNAILAAEDSSFYSHNGVNYKAALRAFIDNRRSGQIVSGASTITMQLARLLWNQPRTFGGKIQQAFDAVRLENTFSKNEILELYINHVPAAPGCQGLEAASMRVTGCPASVLDVAGAALLGGMIQAPSLCDPLVDEAAARRRRDWTLSQMRRRFFITKSSYNEALAVPVISSAGTDTAAEAIQAGHFTDYIFSLGLRGDVHTSLDGKIQEAAQNLAAVHAERFRGNGLTNSAIVVLDNSTAEILAMVGSKDWSADEKGYVNGAVALRQPGSTLKPFAYALAFDKGWNAASLLADIETEYISNERTLYIPRNYSRSFRGPVTAKEALASSLNIPAIRLVRDLGLNDFLDCLHRVGFNSLDKNADYYGLGLVLGNGEVSLLELAGAYSALARGGVFVPPSVFCAGDERRSPEGSEGRRIFSESAAAQVISILSDESMRVQAFGAGTPLLFGFPVAVKTGTSGDWRDSWTAGFTDKYTVAVWSGDFESVSMNQVSGSSGAGILFAAMIRMLTDNGDNARSLKTDIPGMKYCVICAESGGYPHDFCPRKLTILLPADAKISDCTVHSLSGNPPRLTYNLPSEYDNWLRTNTGYENARNTGAAAQAEQRDIRISRPREGDIFITEPGYNPAFQTLEFAAVADTRPPEISWYLNGNPVGIARWPYGFNWQLAKGKYSLTARGGGRESLPVYFEVR